MTGPSELSRRLVAIDCRLRASPSCRLLGSGSLHASLIEGLLVTKAGPR